VVQCQARPDSLKNITLIIILLPIRIHEHRRRRHPTDSSTDPSQQNTATTMTWETLSRDHRNRLPRRLSDSSSFLPLFLPHRRSTGIKVTNA